MAESELYEQVQELRREVARLTAEIRRTRRRETPPAATSTDDGEVSRRHVLRALGGAAVAGIGVAVGSEALTAAPAAAASGEFDSVNTDTALFCMNAHLGKAFEALTNVLSNESPTMTVTQNGIGSLGHLIATNQSSNAIGVFVRHDGTGVPIQALANNPETAVAAIEASNIGTGGALRATASGTSAVVTADQFGTGNAVFGDIENNGNPNSAVRARTNGTGRGVLAEVVNASNANAAVQARTNGVGRAIHGVTTGTGAAIEAEISNTGSGASALVARTNGRGNAVRIENTGAGNDSSVIFATSAGVGNVANFVLNNSAAEGGAVVASTNGLGHAGQFTVTGQSCPGHALNVRTVGTGRAVLGEIVNANSNASAIFGTTNGFGAGVSALSTKGVALQAAVGPQGRAQLRLVPAETAGAPTTGQHDRGEVFLDSLGNLFQCKIADGSGPGVWLRVGYTAIDPVRIVDTRPEFAPRSHNDAPLADGEELLVPINTIVVPVTSATVPRGATAVTVNVTAVLPSQSGHMSLYPANLSFSVGNEPTFSTVNFAANQIVANQATVKIAPPGSANEGSIKVFNRGGSAHVLIDVVGFFS